MAVKTQIRLYLDEDVPHPLAEALRRRGVDAVSTLEAGNRQLADEKQLEYAISQGRAIMTFNIDHFANLHRRWQAAQRVHHGILVSHQIPKRQLGKLLQRTPRFLSQYSTEDVFNGFFYVG